MSEMKKAGNSFGIATQNVKTPTFLLRLYAQLFNICRTNTYWVPQALITALQDRTMMLPKIYFYAFVELTEGYRKASRTNSELAG